MKILDSEQVKKLDEYTIKNEPILSISLMERASGICLNWIMKHFATNVSVSVFAGPGNNGGDGLAIARMLAENGYNVKFIYVAINYHPIL